MTPEEFQREFHSRTLAYQPRFRDDDRPVLIDVPTGAHTPAGHVLLCALTNQLARAHRRLVLIGDLDRPLLCPDVFGSGSLAAASAGVAKAINPFMAVDVVERAPEAEPLISFKLGAGQGDIQLGCSGWRALAGPAASIGGGDDDFWGAMLAACFGGWAAFQRLIGGPARLAESYSLWEYGRPGGADGPPFESPLDVGRVLQVGVGGVGAALDYWLAFIGIAGEWVLVDGDLVEVSNLNRQLLFLAADAGYPGGMAERKANCGAARLGAAAVPNAHWYGDVSPVVEDTYDVVLALANERGVRGALQDRQPPVLLHATTSASSQGQLHRHVSGRDDCIRCRLPGEAPHLACSEVPLDDGGNDAALPFLSGAAGLLLATGIARLASGALVDSERNLAALDFGGPEPMTQLLRSLCQRDCRSWGPPQLRRAIAEGTRYEALARY